VSLPPEIPQPIDRPDAQPEPGNEFHEIEREMTGFERGTLRWAKVAVLMSALAAIFVCLQWWEMHTGGKDTSALAQAAGTQANKMKNMSEAADDFKDSAFWIEQHMDDAATSIQDSVDTADRNAQKTLRFQKQSGKAMLEEMQTQTRLSVRPYVGLDESSDVIQTAPLDIEPSMTPPANFYPLRVKNYSISVATNVFAVAALVVADDMYTVWEEQSNKCSDALIGKPEIGFTVFPNRDKTLNLAALPVFKSKHPGSRLQVWLTGCVSYRDQFNYLYRTKFMFMLVDENDRIIAFDPPKHPLAISGHFIQSGGSIDSGTVPKYK
jgi:hypothetical protein